MENAFLYEYLKYVKDELKFLENPDNIKQVNTIKAIISNDARGNIRGDYSELEEVLSKLSDIVESIKSARKRSKQKRKEEKELYDLGKGAGYKLKRYEKAANRIRQYLVHYEAMLKNWDCSFIVIFENDDVWSVNYTRSLRKDRIDTHIARFNYLHSDMNLLVVPDYRTQDDLSKPLIKGLKDNPSAYGTPVVVVSFEELLDLIMANIFGYRRKDGALNKVPSKVEAAIINGVRGAEIEKIYGKCLSNKKNYDCYINRVEACRAEETDGSFLPSEFSYIMDYILSDKGIKLSDILKIEALDIGELKLKPDVYIWIYLNDGTVHEAGISIKSSGSESVSFHEKKAEDFIRVLEINDEKVKSALIHFQEVHAVKNLFLYEQRALTDFFSDENNKRKLVTWVVCGEERDQYRTHYVLCHHYGSDGDSLGINIISASGYIDEIMSKGDSKTFNSGFSWTYKNVIQLKGSVL